ncbi:universal stress protein family domain protein [Aspergillus clavatus NRRL 1]|uniref:Universal stress protein family domain protein n=1 Tax=Aspergillus clavatus (strain ATCC 1007 / CBS 513.65 / DSM 816 / NCTC 3887 / NRRL 1 / QM 1276 / 107) TaxID=344612 RepID=A1C6Z9_ASPCL|nr:universal stress protein family domain protein [Aspergillus clavatus NRRL 1]EAW14170.1 universal stress protein family domain protein [Aspergillus clavatus NRRL 1]
MAYSTSAYYTKKRARSSLATALEEERLEWVDESQERRHESGPSSNRRNTTQAAPVRSLLDIAPSPGVAHPRHGSIAGIGVGVTSPSNNRYSWQGPVSSSSSSIPPLRTATPPATATASSSVSLKTFPGDLYGPPPARRSSDNSDHISIGKKRLVDQNRADEKLSGDMAFGAVLPRRTIQIQLPEKPPREHRESNNNKPTQSKSAMAAMMSGLDLKVGLPSFARGRAPGRQSSTRGTSLDSRLAPRKGRSGSPKNRWLSTNPPNLSSSKPGKSPVPDKGKSSAMNNAHTNLSDPDLHKSVGSSTGGVTSPVVPAESPDAEEKPVAPTGDERLAKDLYDSENNPMESSEDEPDEPSSSSSSSSDDDGDAEPERGRKKPANVTPSMLSGPLAVLQQLDGAAGERMSDEYDDSIDHKVKSKSLAAGHSAKHGPPTLDVQPRASLEAGSALTTPFGSDDEAELSDIKRAQKLSIQMSSIDNSVHNRSIRTIIRGDYPHLQEGRRRQRRYLVATDLSEESVYALEWTIGTILRDGDTMFAVCAVNEEMGMPAAPSVQIGEGAQAMQDAAAVVGSQTEETVHKSQNETAGSNISRAFLSRLGGTDSRPGSVDARGVSRAEVERNRAVEVISQTCVRLLRKTLLQVRVAVEVIHCKSPKHMITEAIDGLEPTLVIVGARGRSALKGVLLGSFSNYLVMSSSVPVMVARKKLRKTTKKKANVRLSNNLATPKKLALAKID